MGEVCGFGQVAPSPCPALSNGFVTHETPGSLEMVVRTGTIAAALVASTALPLAGDHKMLAVAVVASDAWPLGSLAKSSVARSDSVSGNENESLSFPPNLPPNVKTIATNTNHAAIAAHGLRTAQRESPPMPKHPFLEIYPDVSAHDACARHIFFVYPNLCAQHMQVICPTHVL